MKKMLIFFLALVIGTGFSLQGNSTAVANGKLAIFTGEQLFAGLFFAQGEVAKRLSPTLYSKELLAAANTPEALLAAKDVINKVKTQDAQFFSYFKSAIESKNPLQIQMAFERGGELLISIYKEMNLQVDLAEFEPGSATGQCLVVGLVALFYAGVVAQVAAGLVYVVGGAVYFYAAAVQKTHGAVNSIGEPRGNLSNEIFIKNIVTAL
ncbi:sporulation delaying protein family toxin [Paenibacillus sp. NPDC057967]|uniref:sporulation delaying protein family toxin n=1 Tax=Paenibacillus sp. NPDC057967 TaxID=3346293 RepID=UPI0036D9846C